MSIYVNDCITLGDYDTNLCGDKELARVRAVAFVKKSATIADPTDDAEWEALVTSGDAILIPRVRGNYDGGTDTESAGFGSEATEYTGKNHTLTYFDPNLKGNTSVDNNRNFYDILRKSAKDFKLWFVTETILYEAKGVPSVSAKTAISENTTDQVNFEVMVKWQYEELPTLYTKPATFFGE